jgi:hypothetical protein
MWCESCLNGFEQGSDQQGNPGQLVSGASADCDGRTNAGWVFVLRSGDQLEADTSESWTPESFSCPSNATKSGARLADATRENRGPQPGGISPFPPTPS